MDYVVSVYHFGALYQRFVCSSMDEANAQFDRLYKRYGDDDSYYINMRCPVNMQKTLFQRVLDFLR